jgi:hypothetical protein
MVIQFVESSVSPPDRLFNYAMSKWNTRLTGGLVGTVPTGVLPVSVKDTSGKIPR